MPMRMEGTRGIFRAKTRTTGIMGLMRAIARTFFSLPVSAAGMAQALRTLEPRLMENTIQATATTIRGMPHSQE